MIKSKLDISVIILLIVVAIYSLICITKFQYDRVTADSMLYISIAQKYLTGDFQNAINGYWGPLLSWLIIPFLYLGSSDVFAINALNLIFGIFTIIGTWILFNRFEITEKTRNILVICLLPIILKFSLVQPMDFLLVCIIIFYLGIVFDGEYHTKISSGMLSGVLGSLAYFTKAYAFPFFIVHFLVMNIFHVLKNITKESRIKVLKNAIAGLALFSLISGTWIMIISDKYGHHTFSTMRDTNFNAPGPEVVGSGLEFGVPVFYEGFFEPPNQTAFVVWEDPSYLRGKRWSPWQSSAHFKHFIKLTLKNIDEGLRIYEKFSTFSIAIIITCVLLLISKPISGIFSRSVLLYPLFTIVLFSGGYVLFHFEERYLWLANVLLLCMGGHLLSVLFEKEFFQSNARKNILIILFIISFIFAPSRFILQAAKGSVNKSMYDLSIDLKQYNIKGNIASNREPDSHDAWHKTFRLAYLLNSRYYGQRGTNMSDEELEIELNKYNIDYYFFWGESNEVPEFLDYKKEITNGEIHGLKIYALKGKKLSSH